ncbi:hypothetical protein Goklo_013904 [Gossypium klotzschianum]|uniref:Uncharacterized protein n=1 Tax=Gossypium klotzschianum TaxID=34286 RepID=A0A7J8U6J8_9ROSI|nr:hypothetical protein [Gossypium klotzschianum]
MLPRMFAFESKTLGYS